MNRRRRGHSLCSSATKSCGSSTRPSRSPSENVSSGDVVVIHDAISDKFGTAIQFAAQFVGGFAPARFEGADTRKNDLRGAAQLVVGVDGDDLLGSDEGGSGDRGVPDAAAADDGDGVIATDVAGVDGGADAGHHAAAE